MKRFLPILIIALIAFTSCISGKNDRTLSVQKEVSAMEQTNITGDWQGTLEAGGASLRLAFHITANESGLSATMDSLDQGVTGIQADSVVAEDGMIELNFPGIGASFKGDLTDEKTINGQWEQGPGKYPLVLEKQEVRVALPKRPQDPEGPFPYRSEDVKFVNTEDGITLAGTLTFPESGMANAAVVLISGSGAQNRNEELMNHRPFLVLSDYLTRHEMAVLRFDDRGVGESEGDFGSATTLDFARDVNAAVEYLLQQDFINIKHIGLAGHSEGGIIAPYAANRNKAVDFVILLAGPGVNGKQVILSQSEAILRASGVTQSQIETIKDTNRTIYDIVLSGKSDDEVIKEVNDILQGLGMNQDQTDAQLASLLSPWYKFFLEYDPAPELEKLRVPVLAVNGSLDLQVLPEINLPAIEAAVKKGGNSDITIKEFDGLNHLFQTAQTGMPQEYEQIEETFSEQAMQYIADWINTETAKN